MLINEEITDQELIGRILDKNPNWKRNEKHIRNIIWAGATNELRFIMQGDRKILQQRYGIKVYFDESVSYGSFDGHWTDQDIIWINVPAYTFIGDEIDL